MTAPNGNGGLVGAATKLGQSLIGALPPSFIALMVLNLVFLGLILWFIDDQLDTRMRVLSEIIQRCLVRP